MAISLENYRLKRAEAAKSPRANEVTAPDDVGGLRLQQKVQDALAALPGGNRIAKLFGLDGTQAPSRTESARQADFEASIFGGNVGDFSPSKTTFNIPIESLRSLRNHPGNAVTERPMPPTPKLTLVVNNKN